MYRPGDYPFPPARGRVGFEFREGGEFVYYGIAPADGIARSEGRWRFEGAGRVRIELENRQVEPFTLEFLSCDGDTLKVRR